MVKPIWLLCLFLIACRTADTPPAPNAWIPPDPAKACTDAKDVQLCTQLLAIRDRDQLVRRKWLANREDKAVAAEVESVDQENLVVIEKIIAKHGYPGKSLVGEKAAGAAWTVIQHADLATQKKYLDVMTRAVDAGDLSGALLATTVDRILVAEGKPQTYGTQFHEVNGEMVPFPIEDEAHVDERRAKVGMQTLAEYTAQLRQVYAQQKKP